MPRFTLTPRAARDRDDIWDYSADRWSVDQANGYPRTLQHSMGLLADNPHIGRACDEIAPGYRKHTSGGHVIFYRVAENSIEIVRVLHQRMDIDEQF